MHGSMVALADDLEEARELIARYASHAVVPSVDEDADAFLERTK
jgi:hypothetical protein